MQKCEVPFTVASGCEYGDHEESCARIKRAHCYNATTRRRCCTTCGRLFNASAVGTSISTMRPLEYSARYAIRPSVCHSSFNSNMDSHQRITNCWKDPVLALPSKDQTFGRREELMHKIHCSWNTVCRDIHNAGQLLATWRAKDMSIKNSKSKSIETLNCT